MSDNMWTDQDLTDILGDPSGDNSTIKLLREKIKADNQALRDMRNELTSLREERREDVVGKALKSAGLNPNASGMYQGEVNPTAVQAWVEANKEYIAPLGVTQVPVATEPQMTQDVAGTPSVGNAPPVFTPDSQAAYARMMSAGVDGVPASNFNETLGSLQNAKSMEDLLAVIQANG